MFDWLKPENSVDGFIRSILAACVVAVIGALFALWLLLRCLLLSPSVVGATLSLAVALWLGGYQRQSTARGRRWAARTCIGVAALCLVSHQLYPDTETTVSASLEPPPSPPSPPSVCKRWCSEHEEVWARKCVWRDGACSACSECFEVQVRRAGGRSSDLAASGSATTRPAPAPTSPSVPRPIPQPAAPPAPPLPSSCGRLCLTHATGGEWPSSPLWLAARRLTALPCAAAAAGAARLAPPGSFARDFWPVLAPLTLVTAVALASLARPLTAPALAPLLHALRVRRHALARLARAAAAAAAAAAPSLADSGDVAFLAPRLGGCATWKAVHAVLAEADARKRERFREKAKRLYADAAASKKLTKVLAPDSLPPKRRRRGVEALAAPVLGNVTRISRPPPPPAKRAPPPRAVSRIAQPPPPRGRGPTLPTRAPPPRR
jgi:hypothetical protein